MAPCLSKLPSVCLEAIFKHVPLVDLLHSAGLVCSAWYKARRTELMRRRRLVIVQRKDQLENLNHHMLYCCYETDLIQHVRRDDGSLWLSPESLEQIKFNTVVIADGTLDISFPSSLMFMSNITNLTFMFKDVSNYTLTQIIRIIQHFSEHLFDLKLSLGFRKSSFFDDEDELDTNLTNLFDCFENLPSLKHLGLDQRFFGLAERGRFSFLPRLTSFNFRLDNFVLPDEWILFALSPFAPNIDSINIYNTIKLEHFLQVDLQQASKFIVLSMRGPELNKYDDMRLFCSRFSSLTKLSIKHASFMPMTMLARCLAQLPRLVHLDLVIPHIPGVEEDQLEIAQVLSVRLLNLSFLARSHHDTERLFIAEIFPNLQVQCGLKCLTT